MTKRDRENVREAVARGEVPPWALRTWVEMGIADVTTSWSPQEGADALQFAADLARVLAPLDFIPAPDGTVDDEIRDLSLNTFHPHQDPDRFHIVVNRCLSALEPIRDRFTLIAVRGASGITVGSVVAWMMKKRLMVVRKKGESVHCFHRYSMSESEPLDCSEDVLFLDDFIQNGATYQAVKDILGGPPLFTILYSNTPFQGPKGAKDLELYPIGEYLWETAQALRATEERD